MVILPQKNTIMEQINNKDPRSRLAYIATIASVGFGIAGTIIAPMGIIDSSMLYLIAQLLIFAATLLGFGTTISKVTDLINQNLKNKKQCEK